MRLGVRQFILWALRPQAFFIFGGPKMMVLLSLFTWQTDISRNYNILVIGSLSITYMLFTLRTTIMSPYSASYILLQFHYSSNCYGFCTTVQQMITDNHINHMLLNPSWRRMTGGRSFGKYQVLFTSIEWSTHAQYFVNCFWCVSMAQWHQWAWNTILQHFLFCCVHPCGQNYFLIWLWQLFLNGTVCLHVNRASQTVQICPATPICIAWLMIDSFHWEHLTLPVGCITEYSSLCVWFIAWSLVSKTPSLMLLEILFISVYSSERK